MATLNTAQQEIIQKAIDLMLKGTAIEIPFADDVIEQLAQLINTLPPVIPGVPLVTTGGFYQLCRDNPVSTLIFLVAYIGSVGTGPLTASEVAQLFAAANLMLAAQAREIPFSEDVIQRLAPVAVSSGFEASTGNFYNSVRDNPISTMLRWALYVGSK